MGEGVRRLLVGKKKQIHGSWEKCLRPCFRTPVEGKRDRWGGQPPDWGQWAVSPGPSRGHATGLRLVGECLLLLVLKDVALGGTRSGIL